MKLLCLGILLGLISQSLTAELVPGNSVFGEHNFIEYLPGDLPLIIAAPHGGEEKPDEIPNRKDGVVESDAYTQELARTIAAVVHAQTGHHLALVLCRLHRSKLDVNREILEAAQGNPWAEQAWKEHHDFIDQACAAAIQRYGVAFLIDLHGHGHKDPRVELGYLHYQKELEESDEVINQPAFAAAGSLHLIATRESQPYTELLRGTLSLGALLEKEGFLATPSPRMPVPTEPYFRGGYTISRHCVADAQVTGLQIEANRIGLRDTPEHRLAFAQALVRALDTYFSAHLGFGIAGAKNTELPQPLP